MQAKRSSRGSNATQTRRIIIILNSNLVLCCIYRGLKLAYAETKRTDSCLMWKLRKDRRLENMSIFFIFVLWRHWLGGTPYFTFPFISFAASPSGLGSRALLLGRSVFRVGALLFQCALRCYHALLNPQRKTRTQCESVLSVSALPNRGRSCLIRFSSPPSRSRISAIKVGPDHMSPVNISSTHRPLMTSAWHFVVGLTEIKLSYSWLWANVFKKNAL